MKLIVMIFVQAMAKSSKVDGTTLGQDIQRLLDGCVVEAVKLSG